MRSKERIKDFLDQIADRWEDEAIVDWRFGQLMSNFNNWLVCNGRDWFYMEEDCFMEYFDLFLKVIKNEL